MFHVKEVLTLIDESNLIRKYTSVMLLACY